MKVTNRNARIDRAGKHNDRNFNLEYAPHINAAKSAENMYWTYNGDTSRSFADIEEEFYKEHFSDYIELQNRRNESSRHKDRNNTVSSYHSNTYSRPEDKILQIGNVKEHASKEELWGCAMAYKDRFEQTYGDHCKILDMALHMDEATPHVHVRRVWISEKDGLECVSQNKALSELGVNRPDMDKPESKFNNAKITLSNTDRELFQDICIEQGINIERSVPAAVSKEHLDVEAFKLKKLKEEEAGLERTISDNKTIVKKMEAVEEEAAQMTDTFMDYFENDPYRDGRYELELQEFKQTQDKAARLQILENILKSEIEAIMYSDTDFDKAVVRSDLERMNRTLKEFISYKGLCEEYETYKEQQLSHNR